jgi:hypothetical protein
MPFDALQRVRVRERSRQVLGVPDGVGSVAVGLAVVLAVVAVLGVVVAGSPGAAAGLQPGADGTIGADGTVADGSAGSDAVEPTLSVPDPVNRTENLTATVGLPERANTTRTFRVRLEPRLGTASAIRNVTLAPGETTTVDFGACLAPESYTVRIADADGDILVADQTEILAADSPLTIAGHDEIGFAETVRRGDDLRLDATFHACVDRATLTVDAPPTADRSILWRATVVDRDGDDAVALTWDVDATGPDALAVGDGDALANVTAPAAPTGYGEYGLAGVVAGEDSVIGSVTVSFATPTVEIYAVNRTATASAAIDRAANLTPVGYHDHAGQVLDGQWVVVRVDTDGTIDSLDADDRLVAPARHENATIEVGTHYGPGRSDTTNTFALGNATRWFDAANATVWYAARVNDSVSASRIEYVAFGDGWNATAEAGFTVAPRAAIGYPDGMMLAPDETVEIPGLSPLPGGTRIDVAVRADGDTISRDTVTVGADGDFEATVDLSGVANGTNATVVVLRAGRELASKPVAIDARPDLSLQGFHPEELSRTGNSTVTVYLENRGTHAGRTNVTVTIENATTTRTVRVPPQQSTTVAVTVPTDGLDAADTVEITVTTDGDIEYREVEIQDDAPPPNRFTSVNQTTRPAHTTEPWPTLAGSRSPADDSPLPGFGPAVAVGALLAVAVAVARRRTG